MAEKEVLLTAEGLARIEKELEHLKTVKRREVAARIKQALEFGDISENSEYDDAKNEQAFIEGRIAQLEKMLRNARVIEDRGEVGERVAIGTRVSLRDLDTGEEMEYTVVGSAEADPAALRISNESPVGKAILGKKKGDVVEVHAPGGLIRLQILDLQR